MTIASVTYKIGSWVYRFTGEFAPEVDGKYSGPPELCFEAEGGDLVFLECHMRHENSRAWAEWREVPIDEAILTLADYWDDFRARARETIVEDLFCEWRVQCERDLEAAAASRQEANDYYGKGE
jgi:hypothetical protein